MALLTGRSTAQSLDTSKRFSIFVLDFELVPDDPGSAAGAAMASHFQTSLQRTERFSVVTRNEGILGELRSEIIRGEEGFVDPDLVKEFGRLQSADVLVTGEILTVGGTPTVTAVFLDVETGEELFREALPAAGDVEFASLARRLAEFAVRHFATVIEVQDERIIMSIGRNGGLASGASGEVLRRRDVGGLIVHDTVASFELSDLRDTYAIATVLAPPTIEIQPGDEVRFDGPMDSTASGGSGVIVVRDAPYGARVFVDERQVGVVDEEDFVTTAPVGSADVRVEADGYRRCEAVVDVTHEAPTDVRCTFTRATGRLTVTSAPSRSRVFIDGAEIGLTPIEDLVLDAEGHEVRIERDGFASSVAEVAVTMDEETLHDVTLVPEPVRVTIETDPEEARLYVDNVLKGERVLTLAPGTYTVLVQAPNHHEREVAVQVNVGEPRTIRVALEPFPARLELDVPESRFAVLVDGEPRGQVTRLALSPGTHEIEVRASGKRPTRFTVTVSPAQSLRRDVVLEEEVVAPPELGAAAAEAGAIGSDGDRGPDTFPDAAPRESSGGAASEREPAGERRMTPPPADVVPEEASEANRALSTVLDARFGTLDREGRRELIAVVTVADASATIRDVRLRGSGATDPIELGITSQADYQRLEEEPPAEDGAYELLATVGEHELQGAVTFGRRPLEPVDAVDLDVRSESGRWTVSATWNAPEDAKAYEVRLDRIAGEIVREVEATRTDAAEAEFRRLRLQSRDEHRLCVLALNWDPSASPPADTNWRPMASEVCHPVELESDRDSRDRSDSRGDDDEDDDDDDSDGGDSDSWGEGPDGR